MVDDDKDSTDTSGSDDASLAEAANLGRDEAAAGWTEASPRLGSSAQEEDATRSGFNEEKTARNSVSDEVDS